MQGLFFKLIPVVAQQKLKLLLWQLICFDHSLYPLFSVFIQYFNNVCAGGKIVANANIYVGIYLLVPN
jgi:hypothetical protein